MAKMSPGAKAARVLTFLMGMRNPRIASAMAAHGFDESELDEGWSLLRAVGMLKVDPSAPSGGDRAGLEELDAWENRWFPIASAALERRWPAIHAHLFANLAQTEGLEVMLGVQTLLERLDAMAAGAYGSDGAQAKSHIEARGLTAAVMDEARALLERLRKVAASPTAQLVTDTSTRMKAEHALWAWYLEWSRIARVAVTQRALLRQLGFAPRGRSSDGDDEDDEVDEDEPPTVVTTS
jgi:hypothetical protein